MDFRPSRQGLPACVLTRNYENLTVEAIYHDSVCCVDIVIVNENLHLIISTYNDQTMLSPLPEAVIKGPIGDGQREITPE